MSFQQNRMRFQSTHLDQVALQLLIDQNIVPEMMNFGLEIMDFALEMMNSVLYMMGFVFKMMNFVFKMQDFRTRKAQSSSGGGPSSQQLQNSSF